MNPEAHHKLIQLSMHFYAKYCKNLLAQGRSENQVKAALRNKVKHAASEQGIEMVYRLGCQMWAAEKEKSLPVIVMTNGNN